LPKHLERREVVLDLTEAEKLCPCCGKPRVCIGEQATEQLDMEPIRFFVLRTIKKTYCCRDCNKAQTAARQVLSAPPTQQPVPVMLPTPTPIPAPPPPPPPPQTLPHTPPPIILTAGPKEVGPLARALCGPGLLAHVITAKFADHTPVHRLAGQLARSGVEIACSTLGDWLAGAAKLLEPLYDLMHKRLKQSRVIHGDDTGVKLRVKGLTQATGKAHLWVCIGDADHPYVVFDFTADYKGDGPQTFLKDYKGYLQADALAQYEGLYGQDKVKHVCCWAHARRKFVVAFDSGDECAEKAVELIGKLYAIERQLPELLPASEDPGEQEQRRHREEQRQQRRQQEAEPILAELKKWLEQEKIKALPKSPLGKAIGYALNNWEALKRYMEQGYLAIDNNLSERTLRMVALGRNNWGVIGSEAGGKTAAVLYTMTGTCKHLGIDPFAYLREALQGIFELGEKPTEEKLQEWLPDWWAKRRARESPSVPAATG
jgi:transposase